MDKLKIHDPIDTEDFIQVSPAELRLGGNGYLIATEHRGDEVLRANVRINRETATELRDFLNGILGGGGPTTKVDPEGVPLSTDEAIEFAETLLSEAGIEHKDADTLALAAVLMRNGV